MVTNVNYLSKFADSDQCVDETTYGTNCYGEPCSGLISRLVNKPFNKGGQVTLMMDVHRFRPRAYVHRHKLHERPSGYSREGPNEVRMLMQQINKLIRSENNPDGIFKKPPHMTLDNYFVDETIRNDIGKSGYASTSTCWRDLLPGENIPGQYWHKKKTDASLRTKVARYLHPVVGVKRVPRNEGTGDMSYEIVHTSFQSTSSCNITCVNSLSRCELFVSKRERGRGKNKRKWAIEMNHARQLYLATYGVIDTIDQAIKASRLFYCSWKYWHSPMLHAKAMIWAVAYSLYEECSEGMINLDWKVTNKVDFWTFRDVGSEQLLAYNPKKRKFIGDKMMRVSSQQNTKQRTKMLRSLCRKNALNGVVHVTRDQFHTEKVGRRLTSSRLCGSLDQLNNHITSIQKLHNPVICEVCGKKTYSKCGLCNKGLHFFVSRGKNLPDDNLCFT